MVYLILSLILCFIAIYITYVSINIYDDKYESFYIKYKNVPLFMRFTFLFNIFCFLTVFIINIIYIF